QRLVVLLGVLEARGGTQRRVDRLAVVGGDECAHRGPDDDEDFGRLVQRSERAARNGVAPEYGKDDYEESDKSQHNCDPSPPGFVCCIYRPIGDELEQAGKRDMHLISGRSDRGGPHRACVSWPRSSPLAHGGTPQIDRSGILKNCYDGRYRSRCMRDVPRLSPRTRTVRQNHRARLKLRPMRPIASLTSPWAT